MYRPALIAVVATAFAFWLPGGASPARSQLEPEAFTILKAAATKIPPDPRGILCAMQSCKTDEDRQIVADVWLKVWQDDPSAFGTFGVCLDGGENAKEAAAKLIKILQPTLAEEKAQQAGSGLVDQLSALSAAERQRLQEFTKLAKARIRR